MDNIFSTSSIEIRKSMKARANAERRFSEKAADWMTARFGTVLFLTMNIAFFALWILANLGVFGSFQIDPYPFGMLTLLVSLESIVLSIAVIISQNRQAKIADVREEMDFYINLVAEREITKILKLVELLLKKNGVDFSHDPELQKMLQPLSAEEIEAQYKKEIEEAA